MKRIQKDVLLISRPDHSYNIYSALKNSGVAYTYMVFKLFPRWMSFLFGKRKLRELDSNYSVSWLMTIFNTLHYNFHWSFLSVIPESLLYRPNISRYLFVHSPKIIHYWPEYCFDYIKKYKMYNPTVKTIAEIVFLNEKFVLEKVGPYLESVGLGSNLDYIKRNAVITEKVMLSETDFFVPSKLVAETFKIYYPDKRYHIQSYGITINPNYKKKCKIASSEQVKSFVYAGTISVEKGCDIVCKWFSENSNKEIHLYGHIHHKEHHFFNDYKKYKNIHFHGSVPKTVLQDEIKLYDAGIHLSRFDSYSLAVAEIIGCGLPVVVSSMTGICAEVEEKGFGIVTELDFLSVKTSLNTFCSPQQYNFYVDAIDEYIQTNPKSYGERIVDYYKTLLG